MTRFYFALLLLAALSSSCQSSRPAFYFGYQSAPVLDVPAAVVLDSAEVRKPLISPKVALPVTMTAATQTPTRAQLSASTPALAVKQPAASQCCRVTAQSATMRFPAGQVNYTQHLYAKEHISNSDNRMFLGGLILLGAGVTVGLLIGGLPGLLVGLALGIPGYLLIGRGYAGSWKSRVHSASQRRSAPLFQHMTIHPTDGGIDALGRFLVKVALISAAVFLLTLVLGLILGSSVAAVIGGSGLGLLALLTILLLSS